MNTNSQEVEEAAGELRLPVAVEAELQRWAAAGYPEEVCGLLVGWRHGRHTETVRATRATNLNRERPSSRYLLDPDDFLAADGTARGQGLEIVGIWHTHPDRPARPSQTDLAAAWPGYSYLIVATTVSRVVELRSWRLADGQFLEETVVKEERRHESRHDSDSHSTAIVHRRR